MQLNRLVNFHKTLGDPTRIRILTLLATGPLHGQAIAGKLGLKAPTITHHMTKLRDTGIVNQRRDKNTIYYHIDEKKFRSYSEALSKMLYQPEHDKEDDSLKTQTQAVVNNFIAADGTLKHLPSQRKKKIIILKHLINGLEPGKKYPEKEINEYIKRFHPDFATIRREFIINHFMYRENNIYELNPKEMWATIE
ncbi:metalloregulator ArsR/SmtB family transcription factor [Pseudalkalibacillus hwajinpoensis]|uniref:Metalloregulator ArsR/SmtB family transcription factor n=1 Tax=Guptibacillus hwajinpoensis TaxID=208199 RepID=A0A4U1MDI7_9BACL|nr:metalloregulator ArsR/SmtB family transcription factor [Pseudalkalibacillus hwajinpoensis]TKD68787.1 metalloregulator ArsR/SmtB family transcription factor [Pseudalkalibacillus hwajinpoensis]